MTAALTPRVRTLIICDGVRASRLEDGVFHLRGVRHVLSPDAFPIHRQLRIFAVLSSPRPGRFPACIKIVHDQADQAVFYGQIDPPPVFPEAGDLLTVVMPTFVLFRQPGRYSVQLWFFQETGADILKMEQPFYVSQSEA